MEPALLRSLPHHLADGRSHQKRSGVSLWCVCMCVCVCVCVCVHICTYVVLGVCVHICTCVVLCVCAYVVICNCSCMLCVCVHMCMCVYVCMYVFMYVYVCTCMLCGWVGRVEASSFGILPPPLLPHILHAGMHLETFPKLQTMKVPGITLKGELVMDMAGYCVIRLCYYGNRVLKGRSLRTYPGLLDTCQAMYGKGIRSPFLLGLMVTMCEEEIADRGPKAEECRSKAVEVCVWCV